MCDIVLALPDATAQGKLIFGKNSDRPVGECQVLHFSPGGARTDEEVACSYVRVPQASTTLSVLGCRPYWGWGYETGINEAGVVGGNTAIFTRALELAEDDTLPGLTGMELLRLGLERGRTAEEVALQMTGLLEQYGQWGSAVRGADHRQGSYDNAYLIADGKTALVLETSGREWVVEKVESGVRTLSNEPTVRSQWYRSSTGLQAQAADRGWWREADGPFDFALCYGAHERYPRQVSHIRWCRTGALMKEQQGSITSQGVMRVLRDHLEDTFLGGPQFHPFLPDFHTVCMHESPAGFTWGNTATSLIVELDPNGTDPPVIRVAYLPPCTSVYLTVPFGEKLPEALTSTGTVDLMVMPPADAPVDRFARRSLWWRQQRMLEQVARDPIPRAAEVRSLFDPIERVQLQETAGLLQSSTTVDTKQEGLDNLCHRGVEQAVAAIDELEQRWNAPVSGS